jgi:hypothetical protein
MRHLATAVALASICACGGTFTNGANGLNPPDGGGVGLPGDGGTDAGTDGGVDAGADAGCTALNLTGLAAVDSCPGPQSLSVTANLTVNDPANGCGVTITMTSNNSPCTGGASHGTKDAFDGGCQGLPNHTCTSASLPGTLNCVNGPSTCTIQICSGSTCP